MGIQNAYAEVYKWVDEKGRVHFSGQPPLSQHAAVKREKKPISSIKAGDDVSKPPPTLFSQTSPKPNRHPDTSSIILTLRGLLEKQQFSALNRILHEYQAAYEADISAEENLFTTYNAFDISDAAYQPLFQAWVAATPRSYQPYLARAKYYFRRGWASRGTKWASETDEDRFNEMNAYFSKALKDVEKTLSLNNKSIVPYSMLLRIANTQGRDGCKLLATPVKNEGERNALIREFRSGMRARKDECIVLLVLESEDLEKWTVAGFNDDEAFQRESSNGSDDELTMELKKEPVDEIRITQLVVSRLGRPYEENDTLNAMNAALHINPATYHVRAHYMNSLTPRWGGSYKAMQAFAQESLKYASKNPRLRMLEGLIYADAAGAQSLVKKYKDANALYTKALGYGANHQILMERGENNYRRERYEDALADLDRAIDIYQEDGEYYYWRSKTHSMLEQYDKAVGDIELASQLKPDDSSIQKQRQWLVTKLTYIGHELNQRRKSNAAIEKYDATLRLDPDNADVYYWRARAFLNKNQLDPARQDLEKAIVLDTNKFEYYKLIDWVLAQRRDWKQIIAYWDQYIALNPTDDRAYVERGGAYYHMGNMESAVNNAKIAADMGNPQGKEAYEKFRHRVE